VDQGEAGGANEIWCLDVNTPEHNGLLASTSATPIVTRSGTCASRTSLAPACRTTTSTFCFSYGTFCHIPVEDSDRTAERAGEECGGRGRDDHGRGLRQVQRRGFDATENLARVVARLSGCADGGSQGCSTWDGTLRDAVYLLARRRPPGVLFDPMGLRDDGGRRAIAEAPGSTAGVEQTCAFARSVGWEVVNPTWACPSARYPLIVLRRPV
jgi:hypothetical protein